MKLCNQAIFYFLEMKKNVITLEFIRGMDFITIALERILAEME